jgi:hypothetical protein
VHPAPLNLSSLGASYSKESDFINTGASAEYLMYTDRSKNRTVTVGVSFMKNKVLDYLENNWNSFDINKCASGNFTGV